MKGMSKVYMVIVPIVAMCEWACNKIDSALPVSDSNVKSLPSDYHTQLVSICDLDDGNFLVSTNYIKKEEPAWLYKVNSNGDLIWKKKPRGRGGVFWKTISVPGKGFLTLGYNHLYEKTAYLNLYDIEGNLMKTDSLVTPNDNFVKWHNNILCQSNGNYFWAEGITDLGNFSSGIFIRRLGPDLKLLSSRYYKSSGYYVYFCKAMCEMADGSISVPATTAIGPGFVLNKLMLKFDASGTLLSSVLYEDPDTSESVNAAVPYGNGIFTFSGKMTGYSYGTNPDAKNRDGIAVNYEDFLSIDPMLISGKIRLRTFVNGLNPEGLYEISGYSGFGMMHSIRKTQDGGYILCGTVNQSRLSVTLSQTRIYLLKLSAGLQTQWTKEIRTTYPTIGRDAIPTADGGYLVAGYQQSLNKRSQVLLIKTDRHGNF